MARQNISYAKCNCDICGKEEHISQSSVLPKGWDQISYLVKKIFGGNSMVNVTISMSKNDYDYIMNELNMARQNTYIKHVHVQLDKKEIVERTNVAYEQIGHVLDKFI